MKVYLVAWRGRDELDNERDNPGILNRSPNELKRWAWPVVMAAYGAGPDPGWLQRMVGTVKERMACEAGVDRFVESGWRLKLEDHCGISEEECPYMSIEGMWKGEVVIVAIIREVEVVTP